MRQTMTNLISTLRGFTNAGTADYTIAGVSYWGDTDLQTVLDRYKTELIEIPLTARPTTTAGGTVVYKQYVAPSKWMESTGSGGSAYFVITDGLGNVQGTALWSADYENGRITFVSDQSGSARYLTANAYDIYGAAADIWQQKAAFYATQIDFSTDNHNIKRSHIVKQCEQMALRYASLSDNTGSDMAITMRGDKR